MSSKIDVISNLTLAEQRQQLREKIQSQRALISLQLGPIRVESTSYPRSNTMRFLTQRPGLAVKLLTEFAALFAGARFIKSIGTAFGFARILHSRIK